MVIHFIRCQKLFYMDGAVFEEQCPVCGSSDAAPVSSTIIFAAPPKPSRAILETADSPIVADPCLQARQSIVGRT